MKIKKKELKVAEIISESELVRHFARGDDSAFTKIYNKYYFIIYRHALRWLPHGQDAEDITADTFVKLWKNKEKFSDTGEIAAFLHVTARNSCYDFLKHINVKTRKQEELIQLYESENDSGQEAMEIWDGFIERVYNEVDKMPKRMREIFLLSFKLGLKPAEIADRLNLNVQTVSNQKSTAISLLKAAFSNHPQYLLLICLLFSD